MSTTSSPPTCSSTSPAGETPRGQAALGHRLAHHRRTAPPGAPARARAGSRPPRGVRGGARAVRHRVRSFLAPRPARRRVSPVDPLARRSESARRSPRTARSARRPSRGHGRFRRLGSAEDAAHGNAAQATGRVESQAERAMQGGSTQGDADGEPSADAPSEPELDRAGRLGRIDPQLLVLDAVVAEPGSQRRSRSFAALSRLILETAGDDRAAAVDQITRIAAALGCGGARDVLDAEVRQAVRNGRCIRRSRRCVRATTTGPPSGSARWSRRARSRWRITSPHGWMSVDAARSVR